MWVNWWAKGGVAYLVIYDWSSNHFFGVDLGLIVHRILLCALGVVNICW